MDKKCQIRKILQHYIGLTPEEIAEREGIEIKEDDAIKCVGDVLISIDNISVILIPSDISTYEKRRRIAHCLGHHFMQHKGNQIIMPKHERRKQEKEANSFAVILLNQSLEMGKKGGGEL